MGTGKDLWNQFETLLNKHDWPEATSLFANDAVYAEPAGRHEGREAIRTFLEAGGKAFSDLIGETNLVIEEGDIVIGEWTYRGTHTGPFVVADGMKIPPTGKAVEFTGVSVCQISDGKFVIMRDYFDSASVMTQLGLMPGT
jgi:steroid delta-isomerase-like uncharacterized protein